MDILNHLSQLNKNENDNDILCKQIGKINLQHNAFDMVDLGNGITIDIKQLNINLYYDQILYYNKQINLLQSKLNDLNHNDLLK